MGDLNIFDEFIRKMSDDKSLKEQDKNIVLRNLAALKDTKVNILITGATGSGKSSTINALFNADKAKVGTGVDPETMDIKKFELDNIVLFDSPGLGDGKDADRRHSKNIISKLLEKNEKDELLIDLVLVILDGSSRDLGTSFELINNVIIPNLGEDTSRLLIAINQADMAMKTRGWNYQTNRPEQSLLDFLEEKSESVCIRIKEATGLSVKKPTYYSAYYGYNLDKLLDHIISSMPTQRRILAQ